MSSDSGYIHIYEPATNSDQRTTLLLLHGTGGDENALSGLGRMLLPGAGQLRPRGNVLENGMPRFFRRFAEGVLDIDDLKQRTADLADFIQQASALYGFDARDHCRRFLQRCQYRRQYAAPASPGGARCHLAASHAPFRARGAGRADPLVPAAQTEQLAELLQQAGAEVEVFWQNGGHTVSVEEVKAAKKWLEML